MPDRRLPLTVQDDHGASHQGEIVIARAWRDEIEPSPDAAFTIVLAGEPLDDESAPPNAPTVAVCAPASPVGIPTTIGEAAAAYAAGDASAIPLRTLLPSRTREAYARGRILATRPLPMTARELFSGPGLRFDALALALIAGRVDAERFWQAADEILCWPEPPTRFPRPEAVRSRLRSLLRIRADAAAGGTPAGDRLQQIASGAAPANVVPSPTALAEDIAFIRCIDLQREGVEELARMRDYLDAARPGQASADLAADHAFTREQLSFVALLEQPHQLGAFRAAFDTFRREYARAYAAHHDAHWRAAARLRRDLHDAQPTAQALARLNTLRALGAPMGAAAIASYQRLLEDRAACAPDGLNLGLREHPLCRECGLTMDDGITGEEAERVLRELTASLALQQHRLASEAVRRILARGGERIDQFLRVAQASDTGALARVLDDELLAFLRDLLAEPVSPTPEGLDLFEQLARAYPVVSEEQVDEVVRTLRQLLTEALAAQPRDDAARPAAFHLASPPP